MQNLSRVTEEKKVSTALKILRTVKCEKGAKRKRINRRLCAVTFLTEKPAVEVCMLKYTVKKTGEELISGEAFVLCR